MRRARRSRPPAFWARAPARRSAGSTGAVLGRASARPPRAARRTCSGSSRNATVARGASTRSSRPPPHAVGATAARRSSRPARGVEDERHVASTSRVPASAAEEDDRAGRLGERPDGRRIRARRAPSIGPGHERGAAQPGLADGERRQLDEVVAGVSRLQVEATYGTPRLASAAAHSDAGADAPVRSRR